MGDAIAHKTRTAEFCRCAVRLLKQAASFAERLRPLAVGLCLLGIFIVAVQGRFCLPPEPVMDQDSLGYLNPALTWLRGEGFCQTDGRAFLYPFVVWAVVLSTHSFSSITIFQHVAGLLSGAAWCWAWWLWVSFLPAGIVRRWLAPALGLVSLAICLWGTRTILFEHTIRPEAVFPLIGMLQLAFGLAFTKARWMGGSRKAVVLYASAGIVAGAVALSLKPSWGFAGLIPFALILLSFWRSTPAIRRWSVLGLCLGILVASIPLVVLPLAAGWKKDRRSKMFLAETLASVHAKMIAKTLEGQARRGLLDPEEMRFSEDFSRTVQAAIANNKSFPVLGVECDDIFYRSGLFGRLPHGASNSPETLRRYLLGLYFQSLPDQPLAFAEKWKNQLLLAYCLPAKELFRPKLRIRLNYRNTLATSRVEIGESMPAVWKARWATYWIRCQDLAAAAPEELALTRGISPFVLKFAAGALLPSLLFLPAFAALVFIRRGRLEALQPAAAASLLIVAISFAATATVAIIHSFDLDRYLNLLVPIDIFLVAAAVSLLGAAVFPSVDRDRRS